MPHGAPKQPKLGLFNKGKSSSKATGTGMYAPISHHMYKELYLIFGNPVPDLIFSESKFLEKNKNVQVARTISHVSSDYSPPITNPNSGDNKQYLVSKYFKVEARNQNDHLVSGENKRSQNNASSSLHYNDTQSRSLFSQKKEPGHQNQEYNLRPQLNRHYTNSNNLSVEAARKGNIGDNYLNKTYNIATSLGNDKRHSTRKAINRDVVSMASSSNESIERILKECKDDAFQVSSSNYKQQDNEQSYCHKRLYKRTDGGINDATSGRPNYFHHINQVPSYSRLKTPNGVISSNSIQEQLFDDESISDSIEDNAEISHASMNHVSGKDDKGSGDYNTTPTFPIIEEYEEDTSQQFKSCMDDDDENEDLQTDLRKHSPQQNEKIYNDGLLLDEWQIENSIITFSDEDNDSRNMCTDYITNEFKRDNKNNTEDVLNFWRNQYKRPL